MLKQFVDLRKSHVQACFQLALAGWFSVSLGSHCNDVMQPTGASLFLSKRRGARRGGGRGVQETVPR